VIRSFDWRDLSLLRRLRDRCLMLDTQQAFTRGPQALQNALLDAVTPGRWACTLVTRPSNAGEDAAIGQVLLRSDGTCARLALIAPGSILEKPESCGLLEALVRAAGQQGARNLIAEVEEDAPAFESLRRCGFAIYARQRIWRLAPSAPPSGGEAPTAPASEDGSHDDTRAPWRRETPQDVFPINSLYLNLVPPLVQQAEPPPRRTGRGWVHWRQGELLGYLNIDRGPLGVWVQPYFHPAAEGVDDLLARFLETYEDRRARPLYLCIRSYQSWAGAVLEQLGFQPVCDQAVMMKRLAALVRQPVPAALPVLERGSPEPTAPFAPATDASGSGHGTSSRQT
jgi:hypothetical protein